MISNSESKAVQKSCVHEFLYGLGERENMSKKLFFEEKRADYECFQHGGISEAENQ